MSEMKKLEELLTGYRVGELKDLAKKAGVTGYSKLKKAELIEVIVKQIEQNVMLEYDISTMELPEDVLQAINSAENAKQEASHETAKAKSNPVSHETKNAPKAKTPILGVAPHVMNVAQNNAMPYTAPVSRTGRKIYPNEPCPCGSGKKYKFCCGKVK